MADEEEDVVAVRRVREGLWLRMETLDVWTLVQSLEMYCGP